MAIDDSSDLFSGTIEVSFELNGEERVETVRSNRTLVEFLRDDLELTGTTEGCGVGVCGCCTVLVDDEPINSCQELAVNVEDKSITTIEGLGTDDELAPVQEAYRCEEGFQCGYCTPGMMIMTQAMFEETSDPDDEDIREYMSENLCRCTGYDSILRAIDRAGELSDPSLADD